MRRLSLVALSFLAACGAPESQDENSSAAEAPPCCRLNHSHWRGSRVTSRATTPSLGRPRTGVAAACKAASQ